MTGSDARPDAHSPAAPAAQFVTFAAVVALWGCSAEAAQSPAPPPQFEVIGASETWLAFREQLPLAHETVQECGYPGVPPSAAGVAVHFLALSDRHAGGALVKVEAFDTTIVIYQRAGSAAECTPRATSELRWKQAEAFADRNDLTLLTDARPVASLGAAVRAEACEALMKVREKRPCDAFHEISIEGEPLQLAVLLTAVPQLPDLETCQFTGHRFVAALQVKWMDLGEFGSLAAPGGFADHYDCRAQLFMPVLVYALADWIVVLASFRGDNMADAREYPHVIVMPREP